MNVSPWSLFFGAAGLILTAGIILMPLALLVVAGIIRKRRAPASSVGWVVTILLLPIVGLPLFWFFGSRKIDRIAKEKPHVLLLPESSGPAPVESAAVPAVKHLGREGLTEGNFIKFHDDGEQAFRDLMALIDTAKRSIHIETYVLKADATGLTIVERLIARAKEGLEVRLLIDGFGSFHMARRPLRQLNSAGGKVGFFLPIWRITLWNRGNLRNHRKIAVFDNQRVFAGGRNLADEYLGPKPSETRWADFSFVLDGPAAAHYGAIFRYDWQFATRETLPEPGKPAGTPQQGGATMQVVPSGPDVTDDELFEGILSFVFAAKRRLWVVSPYFMPNEMLAQALEIACQRGIDVRLIIPAKSDQKLVDLARGQYLRDLTKRNCTVLLYPGMVHAKAVLVDDLATVVGSANFDSRSMFLNFEVSSVIYSEREVAGVKAWIETLAEKTSIFDPAAGRTRDLAEGLARLVAPLL